MLGLRLDTQETRLVFWQRLLRDQPVATEDIDEQLLRLVRERDSEERRAFVLLRSCAQLMDGGTETMRRTLRGTLMYWFSHTGSGGDRDQTIQDYTDLLTLIGRRLTWSECIRHVGGNPDAYSARSRLVEALQTSVRQQWAELFGEQVPMAGDVDA